MRGKPPELRLSGVMPLGHRIYLDHAATTPMVASARTAMTGAMEHWANPSSPHLDGREARALLEKAREHIAERLNWDGEIILTSGATEAIAKALQCPVTNHMITSPIEHDAVLRYAKNATKLAVDLDGQIVLRSLEKALAKQGGCSLVAVQSVNNETGVMQDLEAIKQIANAHNAVLFADCSQSAGKLPLPDADMICVSAHKLGGPPGIGALLLRDLNMIHPTGGQEKGYRAGTENLLAVVGFAAALDESTAWLQRASDLRHQLDGAISKAGGEVVAKDAPRLSSIGGYRMPGVPANVQLIQFDLAGISVSAGSACSSGTLKASHVLTAMGWDEKSAGEVVRVSFGRETSREHVYRFIEVWQQIFAKSRQ